jgi:elongation of very long chain fatty acids protein 4
MASAEALGGTRALADQATHEIVQQWTWFDRKLAPILAGALESAGAQLSPPSRLARERFPTVASPVPLFMLLCAYLLMCACGRAAISAGALKANRNSRLVDVLKVLHNGINIAASVYMCTGLARSAWMYGYRLSNNAYSDNEPTMHWFCFCFYFSKLYEFLDTALFVLGGKKELISFLHVYHHASISVFWWMIAHNAPGGDSYFSATLNSFVHVVMYTYYLLTSVIKSPHMRRKYLWWKGYVTNLQMAQFVVIFVQAVYVYQVSPYPKYLSGTLAIYMVSLFSLFRNYKMSEARRKRKQQKAVNGHENGASHSNGMSGKCE